MSISSRITELKEKRDYYQMEIDNLHMAEPHESYYKMRRYELESQIVFIGMEMMLSCLLKELYQRILHC